MCRLHEIFHQRLENVLRWFVDHGAEADCVAVFNFYRIDFLILCIVLDDFLNISASKFNDTSWSSATAMTERLHPLHQQIWLDNFIALLPPSQNNSASHGDDKLSVSVEKRNHRGQLTACCNLNKKYATEYELRGRSWPAGAYSDELGEWCSRMEIFRFIHIQLWIYSIVPNRMSRFPVNVPVGSTSGTYYYPIYKRVTRIRSRCTEYRYLVPLSQRREMLAWCVHMIYRYVYCTTILVKFYASCIFL